MPVEPVVLPPAAQAAFVSVPVVATVFPSVPVPYIGGLKDETLKDYIRKQM